MPGFPLEGREWDETEIKRDVEGTKVRSQTCKWEERSDEPPILRLRPLIDSLTNWSTLVTKRVWVRSSAPLSCDSFLFYCVGGRKHIDWKGVVINLIFSLGTLLYANEPVKSDLWWQLVMKNCFDFILTNLITWVNHVYILHTIGI